MVETHETTIDQFQLVFPLRLMIRVGEWLESAYIKLGAIDTDMLIAQAQRQTGLSDWGENSFLEDYKVLIRNFEQNPALNLLGRLGMRQEFLRVLTNRLRHVALITQHPEILDIPIERPLFILGLPRTGTTLLHKLFAQDTNMRVAPFWQLLAPFPLTDESGEIRRRIRYAETTATLLYWIAPLFRVMHEINAHEPEECVFLLPHHLVRHAQGDVPKYVEWYLEHDAIADYRYYKQQLQILQWQQPIRHWVMKTPFHLFKLDALLEVFPDASVIQTHRDPASVIPSWCSFQTAVGMMHRKWVNREQIGRDWLSLWKTALDRAMAVRTSNHVARYFDLDYADFVADPVGLIRRVYQHFGYPMSEATEDNMRQWLAKEIEEQGLHRYDAVQFGLSETGIREVFKQYMERFHVRLEA